MSASFVCRLDDDALVRVAGEDAAGFLHNQLAGEVRNLAGSARDLAYCSPKGRVLALGTFFEHAGAIHLALPDDAVDASLQRMRMMVLRAKVEIARVDPSLTRIGVAGDEALEGLSGELGGTLPAAGETREHEGLTLLGVRGPLPRVEVVGDAGKVEALRGQIEAALRAEPASAWRLADVRAGRPRVHAASVDLYLPQFLNLEELGGISFEKGCFPGQEVVARTHYLGKVVRRTFRARVADAALPEPGTPLRALSGDRDKEGGRVLYAAPAGEGHELLAVVPVALIEEGAELRLGGVEGPALELVAEEA